MGLKQQVIHDFSISEDALEGVHIIAYNYTYEDYSGTAYVLGMRKGEGLFEVHGSHCSCYGLENQWSPESVTVEYLRTKLAEVSPGRYNYFHGCENDVRDYLDAN